LRTIENNDFEDQLNKIFNFQKYTEVEKEKISFVLNDIRDNYFCLLEELNQKVEKRKKQKQK